MTRETWEVVNERGNEQQEAQRSAPEHSPLMDTRSLGSLDSVSLSKKI